MPFERVAGCPARPFDHFAVAPVERRSGEFGQPPGMPQTPHRIFDIPPSAGFDPKRDVKHRPPLVAGLQKRAHPRQFRFTPGRQMRRQLSHLRFIQAHARQFVEGLGDQHINIADPTKGLENILQQGQRRRHPGRRDDRLEHTIGRAQAADRDTHLMDRLGRADLQHIFMIGDKLG